MRSAVCTRNMLLFGLLAAILLLGACASANDQPSGSAQNGGGNVPSSAGNGETGDSGDSALFPRTITDATGEVEIGSKPERVAVVHWGYMDSILLFDLEAVGVALPFARERSVLETESYKPFLDMAGQPEIIGEHTTVNLEALLEFQPDLIIAGNAINGEIIAQLKAIATTAVIDEEKLSVWSDWPSLVAAMGEMLGQEEAARQFTDAYVKQLEEGKQKLADVEGAVAFVQVRNDAVWLQGTGYLPQYYEGLGLTAPEHDQMLEGGQLSLEGLSELNPDHLFLGYFNVTDPSLGALTDEWADSAVWKNLDAVRNGRVYGINGELALGYGPIGHSYGVQAVVDALHSGK